MAIVFQDGFESNDFSAWDNDISGTIATSTGQVFQGTYSARTNLSSSGTGFARKAVYGSNQTGSGYARAYIYIATLPSTTVQILRFSNTSNAHVGSLRLTSTGTLTLNAASNATIGSASSALSTNTWYYIELKITAPSNPGTLEGRVNGSSFASGNNSAQGSFARLLLGSITPSATGDIYYDSVVMDDAAYPGASGYTLTIGQGAYTLTGQNATLVKRYSLLLAQGAYTLTGQALGMLRQLKVAIAQGSYALTGQTVTLLKAFRMTVAQGAYALTGQSINLLKQSKILLAQGAYALTGQAVNLKRSFSMLLSQGSYVLTGQVVGLFKRFRLILAQGAYTLSGQVLSFTLGIKNDIEAYYKLDSNSNDSLGNFNGTDTSVTYVTGKVGGAGSYNGSSSKSSLGTTDIVPTTSGQPISVSMWIYSDTAGSDSSYRQAISLRNGFYLPYSWGDAGINEGVFTFTSGGGTTYQSGGNNTMSASTWYHLVGVYDGTNLLTYVNGSLHSSTNIGAQTRIAAGSNTIGTDRNSNDFFDGLIDEVGIWSRALTATEVSFLYNGGTGITYPFTTGYTLALGLGTFVLTGQTIVFKRGLRMLLAQGSYALTGQTLLLKRNLRMLLDQGSYALTGFAVNLLKAFRIVIVQGSYVLTGQSVNLARQLRLILAQGSYVLTGFNLIFRRGYRLLAELGGYVLTGFNVALRGSRIWSADNRNQSTFSDDSRNSSTFSDDSRNSSTFSDDNRNTAVFSDDSRNSSIWTDDSRS